MRSEDPIFICGALRSGSTLFHLMLNSHPEISNPGEFDFLFDKMTESSGYPDIDQYISYLQKDRIFNTKSLQIRSNLSYPELIKSFVAQKFESGNHLALNIHRNFHHAYSIFPTAKYIHLIRDPRDVARSSIGMNWSGNVYYGVDHWLDTEESWDKLSGVINPEQTLEVRFEDLIANTHAVLKKVSDFLGVQYTDEFYSYQENSSYSKPDITLTYQWKRKLSKREIQNVEYKSIKFMGPRGYDKSDYPLSRPGSFERLFLYIKNKWYKFTMGVERYGLYIYLMYRVTGRLGLHSLHKKHKTIVSTIDKDYLK